MISNRLVALSLDRALFGSGYRTLLPILVFLIATMILPGLSLGQRPDLRDSDSYRKVNKEAFEELERIKQSSARELTEMLSRPQAFITFHNNTVSGRSQVSVWWTVIDILAGRQDEARPFLKKMLASENASTRQNALFVLQKDEGENLVKLKNPLLRILDDSIVHLRAIAYRTLGKIGRKDIENRLLNDLATLQDLPPKTPESARILQHEMESIVQGLCTTPVQKEKVVRALISILDDPDSGQSLISVTIAQSEKLSRIQGIGDGLIAAFWRVIQNRSDCQVAFGVTNILQQKDPRPLPWLLQAAELKDTMARHELCGELLRNDHFEVVPHQDLLRQILADQNYIVRFEAMRYLHYISGKDNSIAALRIGLARLKVEPNLNIKTEAIVSLIALWGHLDSSDREDLPELAHDFASTMLTEMDGPLGNIVLRQTGYCRRVTWAFEEIEAKRPVAKAHWEQFLSR